LPLAVWTALSLPLVLLVAGCFALLGSEAAIAAFFADWRAANPAAARVARLVTDWGNPAFYLVFAAMLIRGLRRGKPELAARALAYLAAQLLVSLLIERVLKIGIGRPRPGVGGPFVPFSFDAAHNAMPSGHTTEMTVQTSCLAAYSSSLARPLLLGLALAAVAGTRLLLGAHHPTDLLGGLALGSLGGVLTRRLVPLWTPKLAHFLHNKGSR